MSPIETFYTVAGLLAIAVVFVVNSQLFKPGGKAAGLSWIEGLCWVFGLAALGLGWYYNYLYFQEYGDAAGWWHWSVMMFANPASSSGGQDLFIANLIFLPLWTIIDGRRSGMKISWYYFPMSLLTSYAFAIALFMIVRERQLRWNQAA